MSQSALKNILTGAGLAISPLRSIKTPDAAVAFFNKLGYNLPTAAFGGALPDLASQAGELIASLKKLIDASDDAGEVAAIAEVFGRLVGYRKCDKQITCADTGRWWWWITQHQ